MFIQPAYAQGAGGANDLIGTIVPIVLMLAIFYFLLIRPQQRRMKEHREMVDNVRRGDEIVTSGGIVGKVTKLISDAEIQVEIAENTRVRLMRGTIAEVRSKTEPVKD
ncbi:MAG: preprotein translocase subunit YajC [Pseudomonadota bacterium]